MVAPRVLSALRLRMEDLLHILLLEVCIASRTTQPQLELGTRRWDVRGLPAARVLISCALLRTLRAIHTPHG
jgi:hypothetical protein